MALTIFYIIAGWFALGALVVGLWNLLPRDGKGGSIMKVFMPLWLMALFTLEMAIVSLHQSDGYQYRKALSQQKIDLGGSVCGLREGGPYWPATQMQGYISCNSNNAPSLLSRAFTP